MRFTCRSASGVQHGFLLLLLSLPRIGGEKKEQAVWQQSEDDLRCAGGMALHAPPASTGAIRFHSIALLRGR
jgi:hypothetical protein